jgi:hypothetical protein
MSNFVNFAKLVNTQIAIMSSSGNMFSVDTNRDELYDLYLDSFPEGTNPIHKERSSYDCNCCKHFIRNVANTVSVTNGVVSTIWDLAADQADYPFNEVSSVLADAVRSAKIGSILMKAENKFGAVTSRQLLEDNTVVTWDHFHVNLDNKFVSDNAPSLISDSNSKVAVLRRSLDELTASAVEQVQGLINENMIYRGTEFKSAVDEFRKLKRGYDKLNSDEARTFFVWEHINSFVSKFKNTVIGSLVEDISIGTDLESAVRKYESKVAPENYKRNKSLITPAMIKMAMETVDELGIEQSLHRRFANLADISVNNVLFVNNKSRTKMKDSGSMTDLLMSQVAPPVVKDSSAVKINVDDFMANILPQSSDMAIMFKQQNRSNLVSVTAPETDTSPIIFKWGNNFGWSYNGDVTDSMKQKVKRAGGNVDSIFRVSLNWRNKDDLDIHVTEPDGNKINFGNKCGKLDVDMNVNSPVRDAVENVHWKSMPMDGVYKVNVHNYTKRESIDVGFDLQVEFNGQLYDYSYAAPAVGMTTALDVHIKNGNLLKIVTKSGIIGQSITQEIWGVNTETFVPVNTLIASPNHWDDNNVGNKHWFFILEDCLNPDATRGIYNEYLDSTLDKHRKVFEVLGDKIKCQYVDKQMSGLGFSSTKKDTVIVKTTINNKTKLYELNF